MKSHNDDGTPSIENNLIKLTSEVSLKKYCEFAKRNGYVRTDPPKIEKVFDLDKSSKSNGKMKELGKKDMSESQTIVDDILMTPNIQAPIDYKAEAEVQKKRNNELEKRLKALEKASQPAATQENKTETPKTPKN